MKVRMLTSMCGSTVNLAVGDTHECDAEEAKRLIAAGYAEPVKQEVRKAVKEKRETR